MVRVAFKASCGWKVTKCDTISGTPIFKVADLKSLPDSLKTPPDLGLMEEGNADSILGDNCVDVGDIHPDEI